MSVSDVLQCQVYCLRDAYVALLDDYPEDEAALDMLQSELHAVQLGYPSSFTTQANLTFDVKPTHMLTGCYPV